MWRVVALGCILPALAAAQLSGENWMSKLDGRRNLTELVLPGTHDSGARHEPLPGTAKCQSLSLARQLEIGVRFLDIRLRHMNGGFQVYHGSIDQRLAGDEVWQALTGFLEKHPQETILVSVKEEHKAQGNTRGFAEDFQKVLKRDRARWWLKPRLPSLGEARGRLVLFRRFPAQDVLGFDASRWPDNQAFAGDRLEVQDRYQVADAEEKWREVAAMLRAAPPSAGVLRVNFTSGYVRRAFGIPEIPAVAGPIHAKLKAFLADETHKPRGVLVLDFASEELVEQIWRLNWRR